MLAARLMISMLSDEEPCWHQLASPVVCNFEDDSPMYWQDIICVGLLKG